MANHFTYALVIVALLFSSFECDACWCRTKRGVRRELRESNYAFSGKVIEKKIVELLEDSIRDTYEEFYKITFVVSEKYKGNIADTISIITALNTSGCGFSFKLNENYLVYTNRYHDPIVKLPYTTYCNRTKIYKRREAKKLKRIRK